MLLVLFFFFLITLCYYEDDVDQSVLLTKENEHGIIGFQPFNYHKNKTNVVYIDATYTGGNNSGTYERPYTNYNTGWLYYSEAYFWLESDTAYLFRGGSVYGDDYCGLKIPHEVTNILIQGYDVEERGKPIFSLFKHIEPVIISTMTKGTNNLIIQDVIFKHNGSGGAAIGSQLGYNGFFSNFVLIRVDMIGFWNNIWFNNNGGSVTSNWLFYNCSFHNASTDGLFITNVQNFGMYNSIVKDAGSSWFLFEELYPNGFNCTNTSGIQVNVPYCPGHCDDISEGRYNCPYYVDECPMDCNGDTVQCIGCTHVTFKKCKFDRLLTGNLFNVMFTISVHGLRAPKDIVIEDCDIIGPFDINGGATGLWIDGRQDDVCGGKTGYLIKNNRFSGTGNTAILIAKTNPAVISGNIFTGFHEEVHMSGSCYSVFLDHNTFLPCSRIMLFKNLFNEQYWVNYNLFYNTNGQKTKNDGPYGLDNPEYCFNNIWKEEENSFGGDIYLDYTLFPDYENGNYHLNSLVPVYY